MFVHRSSAQSDTARPSEGPVNANSPCPFVDQECRWQCTLRGIEPHRQEISLNASSVSASPPTTPTRSNTALPGYAVHTSLKDNVHTDSSSIDAKTVTPVEDCLHHLNTPTLCPPRIIQCNVHRTLNPIKSSDPFGSQSFIGYPSSFLSAFRAGHPQSLFPSKIQKRMIQE